MEPWHFSHGERTRQGCLNRRPLSLQWSHGILAMESGIATALSTRLVTLQWSHGILAMERCRPRESIPLRTLASMEPWHFSHGEFDVLVGRGRCIVASMEPWHFSHGELGLWAPRPKPRVASMEPWHFSHGELTMRRDAGRKGPGFNGAMAF